MKSIQAFIGMVGSLLALSLSLMFWGALIGVVGATAYWVFRFLT